MDSTRTRGSHLRSSRVPTSWHPQVVTTVRDEQLLPGGSIPAADILVGINLLVSDRYYYGNLLGLTDAAGVAIITRDELELAYYWHSIRTRQ